jgi:DnaJ-class molecular chaperone
VPFFEMYDRPKEPNKPDYYRDLGVSPDANATAIKKAFLKLACEHHPDKKTPDDTIDAVEFHKVGQ